MAKYFPSPNDRGRIQTRRILLLFRERNNLSRKYAAQKIASAICRPSNVFLLLSSRNELALTKHFFSDEGKSLSGVRISRGKQFREGAHFPYFGFPPLAGPKKHFQEMAISAVFAELQLFAQYCIGANVVMRLWDWRNWSAK